MITLIKIRYNPATSTFLSSWRRADAAYAGDQTFGTPLEV
jgi:hypothetical protein